jgi:hypothetical protein
LLRLFVTLIQLLPEAEEELLGVASNLTAGTCTNVFFYFAPILIEELQAFEETLVFQLSPTALLRILVKLAGHLGAHG